jgi:hypothetical protein
VRGLPLSALIRKIAVPGWIWASSVTSLVDAPIGILASVALRKLSVLTSSTREGRRKFTASTELKSTAWPLGSAIRVALARYFSAGRNAAAAPAATQSATTPSARSQKRLSA